MSPTLESLRDRKKDIEEIARRFGVLEVKIFGSVARGTASETSDLDILVLMESGRSLLDLVGFEQALEDSLGLQVDVVVEGGIHPMLEPIIRREALAL